MDLKNLTQEQRKIIDDYHSNEMQKLKQMCDPLIYRKGVSSMYHDDLYAVASDTLLESVISYNDSKDCSFRTYLTGNIKRAYYDWTRDQRRGKRCNLVRDKHGKIKKDENGKAIVIHNVSFDAPTEDGTDLAEKINSGFQIEDELPEEIGFSSEDKWERYLAKLSKKQRKIAIFLSEGYKPLEIKNILHISDKEYADNMIAIKSYNNISILI